ncbi:MAG TPA: NACHT domain-containing protein [Streptomyces sp.]
MGDQTNLSDGRQVLRDKLLELEGKALKGKPRTQAIGEANDRLDEAEYERPLTSRAVSKWFRQGDPATDFIFLWALVQVLQEWSGTTLAGTLVGPYHGPEAGRWRATEELWKTRWEQAKATPPRRTGLDEEVHGYLDAALKAAEQHPYPGIPGKIDPPSLAEVYVRQRSRPVLREAHAEPHDGSTPEPAEAIFRKADRLCVLIAGAGVGKSTLLRTRLREAAGEWLGAAQTAGKPSSAVPVWVSARALTGDETQVPDALAAATRKLSRYGRHPELARTRFLERPCTGAHWQLLVDDLDELPNAFERRAVLEKLANAVTHDPPLYRCVVATRPLIENELNVLDSAVPQYELQPFTTDDLHTYIEKYFSTRWTQQDATRRAQQFTDALRDASLTQLARNPLMAFMLCQLYFANPERPLPVGRTAVYEAFTDLLYENNQHKRIADSHEEAIQQLVESLQSSRARKDADAAARKVHERLPELINYLAYQWRTGQQTSVAETVASHEAITRPGKVHPEHWDAFLGDLLQHTGLLVHHADGLGFPHQTLLEYHAARHATRDEQARAERLDELFRHGPPALDDSYVGFVLDGLLASPDAIAAETTKRIDAFTRQRGGRFQVNYRNHACRFLAVQVPLGTNLPASPTAGQLSRLAGDPTLNPFNRIQAAWGLAQVEGYRDAGADWLIGLARDPDLTHGVHVQAAKKLSEVEGYRERAAQLLTQIAARLADDSTLNGNSVHVANERFQRKLSRQRAAQPLAQLADDPTLNGTVRLEAARELGQVEGYREHAAQLLTQLADDPTLNGSDRVRSARELAAIPTTPTAGELNDLASSTSSCHPSDRIRAAHALARMDGYRDKGASWLIGLARDPDLTHGVHVQAAKKLSEVEGYRERAAQLLTQIADGRVRAAKELTEVEQGEWYRERSRVEEYPKRAAQLLAQLADDPTLNGTVRREAARELDVIRRRRGAVT